MYDQSIIIDISSHSKLTSKCSKQRCATRGATWPHGDGRAGQEISVTIRVDGRTGIAAKYHQTFRNQLFSLELSHRSCSITNVNYDAGCNFFVEIIHTNQRKFALRDTASSLFY
jgi:hypothetical protein